MWRGRVGPAPGQRSSLGCQGEEPGERAECRSSGRKVEMAMFDTVCALRLEGASIGRRGVALEVWGAANGRLQGMGLSGERCWHRG